MSMGKLRTFFFRNFPEHCSLEIIKEKFSSVGAVVDIFCPNKRDMAGKKFGFVRYDENQIRDIEETLKRLNSLWIGSYKLQVFTPKFNRHQGKKENVKTQLFDAKLGVREVNKSYREAVGGPGWGEEKSFSSEKRRTKEGKLCIFLF